MSEPEHWEDIDLENMRLPKSKQGQKVLKPSPALKIKKTIPKSNLAPVPKATRKRKQKGKRKEKLKGRAARRKKKPKKKRHYQSYTKWSTQDDCVVERKPVYTNHAKRRLAQGRSGKFVTTKKGNAVVIVTILPQGEGPRKRMENIRIHENRKNKITQYKIR